MRILTFIVMLTLWLSQSARGDEPDVLSTVVFISSVSMAAGMAGENSRVKFVIENQSGSRLTFIGIDSPVAETSMLSGRIDASTYTTLDSFSLDLDERLDFSTNHLLLEFGALNRPLKRGGLVPINLHLVSGTLKAVAHVH